MTTNRKEDHVTEGWTAAKDFRWIEAGRLRLDEDMDGAAATIQGGPSTVVRTNGADTWLSATELAGLARRLAGWFTDDPSETLDQIETCATFVKTELDEWNDRARDDEEHPPYDDLTRSLDQLIAKCRRLREVGVLADHPKKTLPPPTVLSSDFSLLHDAQAKLHPAYEAFRRQMRGRTYGEEPLNAAWDFFKQGWADGNGDGE